MDHPLPQTAGIDIAKDRLDVCLCPNGATRHFANDAQGHRALIAWLAAYSLQRVVFEATGAYHRALERCLSAAGLPLACPWLRSIRVMPVASPKPWVSSPKPIGSMQPCWRALAPCSSHRAGLSSIQPWMR